MLVEHVKTFIFWMLGNIVSSITYFSGSPVSSRVFWKLRHGCISSLHLIFGGIQGIFWKKIFSSVVYKSCAYNVSQCVLQWFVIQSERIRRCTNNFEILWERVSTIFSLLFYHALMLESLFYTSVEQFMNSYKANELKFY